MSLRVSTPKAFISACSGDMYSKVPTRAPNWVNRVRSVSRCSMAFATPKSITLGTGLSSYSVTSTLDGLISRWMIPADFRQDGQEQRVLLPIVEFDNRVNKEVRIRRLGTYLSQRRLRFKTRSPGTALLVQQLQDFPL